MVCLFFLRWYGFCFVHPAPPGPGSEVADFMVVLFAEFLAAQGTCGRVHFWFRDVTERRAKYILRAFIYPAGPTFHLVPYNCSLSSVSRPKIYFLGGSRSRASTLVYSLPS